jgi:membrane protein DedA with SNARE-associated domain
MADWIINVIETTGYAGIVFLMFLENVFPPIPSELIMPLAGYMIAQGKQSAFGVIAAGTAGSVLGALPLYYAGYLVGEERLKALAEKYGCWLTVSPEELDRAKAWFDRHGAAAVLICRVVPALRSLISVPAGIASMNLVAFLAYTIVGAAIWTALLVYTGYALGANFEQVDKYLNPVSYVVVGVIAVTYVVRVVRANRKRSTAAGCS